MSETEAYTRFFEVKLELFDGPLDLLLHLVKKRELPIEKVSLAEVTGQYLECIKSLRYYDVEVAAEYLVIAATLLSVKASVLLNDPVEIAQEEVLDAQDPHEELLNKLKELELFRVAASSLEGRPYLGHDVFSPPVKGSKIDPSLIPLADHATELLVKAFQEVLKRLGERSAVFSITIDTMSVVERMRILVDRLQLKGGGGTFSDLLEGATDRSTAIGTFVALLELCRRRLIRVSQEAARTEIKIELVEVSAGSRARNEHREAEPIEVAA